MELKFVVPNMEKTFGNLEYAGESEVVQRQDQRTYDGSVPKLQPL